MKKLIFIALALCLSPELSAQDYINNALLFSRTQPIGSSRIQAMGGSMSALGGDYSSAMINPAGLGMYNRNEVTLSPSLNFIGSTSSYYGMSSPKESRSVFSIPGFSLVLNHSSEKESGFLGGSFAITYSRLNDFHQDYRYSGDNDQNSIIDFFIGDAGTIDPDEFLWDQDIPNAEYNTLAGLAYNNFLIEENYDEFGQVTGYGTVLNFYQVRQQEISERKGSQSQWSFSYGANFNDRFFAGLTLGVASIRYKVSQAFVEDNFQYSDGADVALDNFRLDESYDFRGTGVNVGLGVIYRPVDFLQFGASYISPTYYGLSEKYNASLESNWNNYQYYEDDPQFRLANERYEYSEPQRYEYNISTPQRINAGLALIQKFGLFSMNVEFVNYGKSKYSSDFAGDFDYENERIKKEYVNTMNYSAGIEIRHDVFRFRVGGSYMPDPFYESEDIDRSTKTVAGGIGIRIDNFFADFAVNRSMTRGQRIPYSTIVGAADPLATTKFNSTRVSMTFGLTF